METITTIGQILGVAAMVSLASWICWILITASWICWILITAKNDDDFHDQS